MAFTRDFVLKAGVSEDMVDDVMKEHGIAVQKAKDTVRAAANGDDEANGKEIERLREEIADKDGTIAKLKDDIESVKLSSKIETALMKAGARNLKACKALIDEDAIKMDDKGNLKGLDEQLKALTTDEDTSFLFKTGDTAENAEDGKAETDTAKADQNETKSESGYKPKGGDKAEVKSLGARIAAEQADAAKSANAEGSLWA